MAEMSTGGSRLCLWLLIIDVRPARHVARHEWQGMRVCHHRSRGNRDKTPTKKSLAGLA